MNAKAALAAGCVFVGCCSNVVFLELIVKHDPGAGNLITFVQFALIAVHGLVFTHRFGGVKRHIPMREYLLLVVMFFLTSVANNYAFNFGIPMPLHMVFRAGSLMANMIMGMVILKRKYTRLKYLSVVLITVGIVICTVQSGSEVKSRGDEKRVFEEGITQRSLDVFWWGIGIALLTFALFLSARMGIYQETMYQKRGKHPWEALYYTHALPLPLFLTVSPSIWQHWTISGDSPPILGVPSTTLYLGMNALTQFMCISSVYVLTSECTSLTVTLTVTLRKFVSLIVSIVYFGNSFTAAHWTGALLVFAGTLMFAKNRPTSQCAMECGVAAAAAPPASIMSPTERSPAKAGLHVNFTEKGEVKERREKFLTAKYGSHQMALIRKRLAVEMWLYDELQKLYDIPKDNVKTHEVEVDIDELLDMDSDEHRRNHLSSMLADAKKPQKDVNKFINDLLEKAKTL